MKSTNKPKESTVQIFKKSLFGTLITGSILGIFPWALIALIVFFVTNYFSSLDDWFSLHYIFGTLALTSFLCCCWLLSTPGLALSKKEIAVCRKGKPAIHYPIRPSLHIKITMVISLRQKRGHGGYHLLFLTFIDDQRNLKKRWISGFYSLERTRDLIFALEDHHVRYYLKGYSALLFARTSPYYDNSDYRKIIESTL